MLPVLESHSHAQRHTRRRKPRRLQVYRSPDNTTFSGRGITEPHPIAGEDDATGGMNKEDKIPVNRSDGEDHRPIISGDRFDIRAYAALYTGRTKINRLLFIADKCGHPGTELEALRMAYEETFKGEDTQLFKKVVEKIDGRLGSLYRPNDEWVKTVDRLAELREERLKNYLKTYEKTYFQGGISERTLNEEKVLKGYNDLGDFYYAHGRLRVALDNYDSSRYYCTTANHIVDKCILVSIEMGSFGLVAVYVSRVEQSPDDLDTITIAKLCCAAGLAYLEDGDYKFAALKFLETSPEIRNSYSQVIAARDIATYGGLCALASFPRFELKTRVTDNSDFQEFLKLAPEVKELINSFCSGDYASCLENLGKQKANLLLDIHLHDHVEYLCEQIRKRSIINYTIQHHFLDLNIMANDFKTSVTDLEKELEPLIANRDIRVRFDNSHNKVEE